MGKTLNPGLVKHGCFRAYKFEYKWTIPNFKKLATKNATGSRIESEYINCKLQDKTKSFYLILFPNGFNERVENYLSIFLKKYEEMDEILIQLTIAISDSKNKEIIVKTIKQKMSIEAHIGWISFCRRDFLLDDKNKFLIDENLTLNCSIEIFDNKAIMNAETEDDKHLLLSKMSYDMNMLLSKGDFADVVFQVEDQSFPAHKAILSARSDVFKTMMKSQLKGNSKVIDILDIKVETIKQMLIYIYSGDVERTDVQTAQELYYAADKYDLKDLKKICYKIFMHNMDIKNAIDLLLLGHRHSNNDLIYESIEFIAKNLTEIQEKEEWLSLLKNYPELANSVLKYHLKKSLAGK